MMRGSKLELLLEYAKKEAEMNKEYDREDGVDVDSNEYELNYDTTKKRIETFIRYKEIRTMQHWYSVVFKDSDVKNYAVGRNELDKKRRFLHNSALQSVLGFDKFSERFKLPKLYEGKLLTPEQIESHDNKVYDIRMEMTDFIFDVLKEIEDIRLSRDFDDKDIEYKSFISDLQNQIEKVDRDYGVTKGLDKDEGNIELKDDGKEYDLY